MPRPSRRLRRRRQETQRRPAEDIVVTGTRLHRPDYQTASPNGSFSKDLLQKQGVTNVTTFLTTSLPALVGSETSHDSSADRTDGNPTYVDPKYAWYKQRWVHNVSANFTVNKSMEFYGGVNNLFNQQPDIGSNTYPTETSGTSFYAGFRTKF